MTFKTRPLPLLVAILLLLLAPTVYAGQKDLNVLVVRGGHPYDTPEFEEMCLSLEGIKVDLVLTAHMENMKAADIAEKYDAILFLNQNKHYPEYDKHKKRYMALTEMGVGMVFLQFTLASQPESEEYHKLVGGQYHLLPFTEDKSKVSTYFPETTVEIKVLDKKHPVTKGLKDFTLTDAFYGNLQIESSVTPLLGTSKPDLAPTVAWTHQYGESKVVYILPGYSKGAYENTSYRKLVSNALRYVGAQK